MFHQITVFAHTVTNQDVKSKQNLFQHRSQIYCDLAPQVNLHKLSYVIYCEFFCSIVKKNPIGDILVLL